MTGVPEKAIFRTITNEIHVFIHIYPTKKIWNTFTE